MPARILFTNAGLRMPPSPDQPIMSRSTCQNPPGPAHHATERLRQLRMARPAMGWSPHKSSAWPGLPCNNDRKTIMLYSTRHENWPLLMILKGNALLFSLFIWRCSRLYSHFCWWHWSWLCPSSYIHFQLRCGLRFYLFQKLHLDNDLIKSCWNGSLHRILYHRLTHWCP